MASIGDLFLKIGGDWKGFQSELTKEAEKAGDEAGRTLGGRMSTSLKSHVGTAFRTFSGVASAGFAVMTKGALEAEDAMARYRAETGATAAEAKEAFDAINAIAGTQRQSLEAVNDAAIAVRTNLGLTGQAANDATSDFVEFARVTGQDAAGAVEAFDDILDGFQLDASEARVIQDKLLKSTQKYGGSVEELQTGLAAMAPQLQALNLTYDDGIELLNLFAASGVDAATGQKALNQAIKRLPPGKTLDEFVKDLAAVTDDGERARLAIEVFGPKAGPQLANAIRPGIGSLDDFGISATDAAGAVDAAAEAIDSTPVARFQRFISEAGAALRGFGADFGPAITGAASLTSLLGGLGIRLPLDRLAGVGRRIAGAIAGSLGSRAAIDTVANGIAGAVDAAPSSGRLAGATGRLGKFLGSSIGAAFKLGFLAIAVVVIEQLMEELDKVVEANRAQLEDIGGSVTEQVTHGSTEQLQQSKAALEQGLRDLDSVWDFGFHSDEARRRLQAELDKVNAELTTRMADIAESSRVAGEGAGREFAAGLRTGRTAAGDAARDLVNSALRALLDRVRAGFGFGPPTRPPRNQRPGAPRTGGTGGSRGSTTPVPRQHGGPASPGVPYLVGERHPEVFVPRQRGHVFPSVESFTAAAAPSIVNNSVNLEVQGLVRARDPFEIRDQVRRLADFVTLEPRRGR